jgi:alanyl-tRNA synthetase
MKALTEKAAGLEAVTLASRATPVGPASLLVEAFEDYDIPSLKLLGSSFVKEPGRAIALFTTGAPVQAVVMRSADVKAVDSAAIVAVLAKQFGGKGGGKPESAQGGGFNASPSDLVVFARAQLAAALSA